MNWLITVGSHYDSNSKFSFARGDCFLFCFFVKENRTFARARRREAEARTLAALFVGLVIIPNYNITVIRTIVITIAS